MKILFAIIFIILKVMHLKQEKCWVVHLNSQLTKFVSPNIS